MKSLLFSNITYKDNAKLLSRTPKLASKGNKFLNSKAYMNLNTQGYLIRYIDQLNDVSSQEQVYSKLSNWHFATKTESIEATQDLNGCLRLVDLYQLSPHIATTAIGQLDEIVIVSANPGYSNKPVKTHPRKLSKNALEDAYRSFSKEQNADFCRNFFHCYRDICCGSSPYWTKVINLLELYGRARREVLPAQKVNVKPITQAFGGLDLLPFHSTKDGITRHLMGKNAVPLLRQVALATLAMALRLAPKLLIITSRSGQQLMHELLERTQESPALAGAIVEEMHLEAQYPYNLVRAWNVSLQPGQSTTIVTFPYQIFSGSFRGHLFNYKPETFASVLQDLRPSANTMRGNGISTIL